MQLVLTNKNFWTAIVIYDTINRVLDWSTLKVWGFGARIYQNPNREEHGKIQNPKDHQIQQRVRALAKICPDSKKDYCTSILSERLDKHELHHRHPLAITANTCKTKISQRVLLTNKKPNEKKGAKKNKTRKWISRHTVRKFIELARNPQTFRIAATFSHPLAEKSTIPVRIRHTRSLKPCALWRSP